MLTVESQAATEAAVVGGDDERAGPIRQCGFQPLQGLDVEMVGRLVEQEARRALLPPQITTTKRPPACRRT